ncbi:MAG: glycosyltransferase [Xanthomonadaceae bacterium]|nr:glycosyltransferase [Xanthomonadaceae bacterium]
MQTRKPELTVVIPTYNRSTVLKRCLDALTGQTLSADLYEIIVADDGSSDDTRQTVERCAAGSQIPVSYLWQSNAGANAARNLAITEASGRLLLFINDDTIATPTMLTEHLQTHQGYPDESFSVLGKVTISPQVPYSMFAKVHLDAMYALWRGKKELDWRAFYTCNVSVKKRFLEKYGLFEESMRYHEDLELSERLSHHGLRVIYNPHALGYHYHYLQEKEYLNVAKREGNALAKWYKKSPHLKSELASIGFYLYMDTAKRIQYLFADLIINRLTIPFILKTARKISKTNEDIALAIYKKLFQALKREAIRHELAK